MHIPSSTETPPHNKRQQVTEEDNQHRRCVLVTHTGTVFALFFIIVICRAGTQIKLQISREVPHRSLLISFISANTLVRRSHSVLSNADHFLASFSRSFQTSYLYPLVVIPVCSWGTPCPADSSSLPVFWVLTEVLPPSSSLKPGQAHSFPEVSLKDLLLGGELGWWGSPIPYSPPLCNLSLHLWVVV